MRALRYLLRSAAIVAVIVLAIVAGFALRDRSAPVAGPSASPTTTANASTTPATLSATPTPAATATGAFNDDFGFALTEPGAGRTTTIRRESGARLGSFDQVQFTVSPDGRQIAWFTLEGAQPQQLRIASAASVTQSQLVRTIGAAERGGTIVWSSDASGLLYQTHSVEPPPSPGSPPGDPSLYAIHTFDLRGTTTPDRVVLTSPTRGLVLHPIAWDRTANVAAAVETGEGGFMISYDVLRIGAADVTVTKSTAPNVQVLAFSMSASTDAKLVLAMTFENGGSLWWWPLADFGAHKTITGTGARSGLWRPQTHEIGTIATCPDAGCVSNGALRLIDVDSGTSRIAYSSQTANLNLRTFRADGSAVILAAPQPSGAAVTDFTLVSLTGAAAISLKDVNGLAASVRLR